METTIDSVSHYWALVFWLVATSGGLALLCSGLVFPSLLTRSSQNDPAGKKVGLLLAVNGLGGLVGTELFNSLLIGFFGIYPCFSILSFMILMMLAVNLWQSNRVLALVVSLAPRSFDFRWASHQQRPSILESQSYKWI